MKKLLFILCIFLLKSNNCLALDLDDEISIDDSIDEYHELGQLNSNISFIVMDSLSRSSRAVAAEIESSTNAINEANRNSTSRNNTLLSGNSNALTSSGTGGSVSNSNTSAITSIIIGEGSSINGDLIIIDQSSGDRTAISN